MKRYIFIGNFVQDPLVLVDQITRKDLIDLKKGFTDQIIDTQNGTYFDKENNEWKKIEDKNLLED